MSRRGRRYGRGVLAAALVCTGAVACSSSAQPANPDAVLMPTPWRWIHPTDNDRVMLIDITQGTRNPHDECWEHSVTHTVFRSGAFSISLREGPTALPPNVQCAALAVAGPFYATVHLPESYTDQPLVDATTGETHAPRPLIKLANAPKRFR